MISKNILLFSLVISFVNLAMERSHSDLASATAAVILNYSHSKLHPDAELHPGVPEWPKNTVESCRTIKELARGPYKGKEAKIIRSLWSMCGIDSIYSSKMNHLLGSGLPLLWKFYCELPLFCPEAESSLYYGAVKDTIDDTKCIISESWLSYEDIKNLFNFHRYELTALASQLFQKVPQENGMPQFSPCQELLLQKIRNESAERRTKSSFIKAAMNEAIRNSNTEVIAAIIRITNPIPLVKEIPLNATLEYTDTGIKILQTYRPDYNNKVITQEEAYSCRVATFAKIIGSIAPIFTWLPVELRLLLAHYLF